MKKLQKAVAAGVATLEKELADILENKTTAPSGGQTSSGRLPEEDEPSKYRNMGCTTEEVAIDQINHFTLIPDFFLPTEADRPMVTKTPDGYSCLDGWDLVELAKSAGAATITVDVDLMIAHSDTELCIRKMALRLPTRGDTVYSEIIRNTRDTYQMLLSSSDELRVFSHGGRRDHDALSGNRETDAAEVLARRIRKDRDTVVKHLLHSKYLSEDVIQLFIERQAPKRFFEIIQAQRRMLETKVVADKLTLIEITQTISNFMLAAFEEFLAGGKKNKIRQTQATAVPPDAAVDDSEGNSDDESPEVEDDAPDTAPEVNPELIITIETIKAETLSVSKRLEEGVSNDAQLTEIENSLKAELQNIMTLLSKIAFLNNTGK